MMICVSQWDSDSEIADIEKGAMEELESLHEKARGDEDTNDTDEAFRKKLHELLWRAPTGKLASGSSRHMRREFEKRSMTLLHELVKTKLNAMVAGTGTTDEDEMVILNNNDSNDTNNNNKTILHTALYRKTQKELASKALGHLAHI